MERHVWIGKKTSDMGKVEIPDCSFKGYFCYFKVRFIVSPVLGSSLNNLQFGKIVDRADELMASLSGIKSIVYCCCPKTACVQSFSVSCKCFFRLLHHCHIHITCLIQHKCGETPAGFVLR